MNGEMSDASQAFTIVIGYDGSDAAARALVRVGRLVVDASRILVVAVTPDVRSAGLGAELAGQTFDPQRLLEEARQRVAATWDITIDTRAAPGDPAVVLIELAREVGAGLLGAGRQGGDFVTRTLLGSVAQRVVQQAPCDVLVVG